MADPAWLEISFYVNAELAEALAELLSRFLEGGVVIENNGAEINSEKLGGKLRVFGYLPVDSQMEERKKKIAEASRYLGQIEKVPEPSYTFIEDANWMEAWKQHYHPIEVGKKILILPAWIDPPSDGDRIAIQIDPGMAFGTGAHPTTQLCLEWLERLIKPGSSVIDVGCGSGILSIAAAKLGADRVLAVDVDKKAVELARESAVLNNVGNRIDIVRGSVKEILDEQYSITHAPIVVANILSRTLMNLLTQGLGNLITRDGRLMLSGILEENE
ncbi:MAG: 50S ribosomal protein L11 methyltransferase [Chloroflexi bacterium]|nr:50S ribosomal protein L11 methyltransferase [Chloroflexota bacterium]